MRENKLADLSMQLAVKRLNFTDEIEGHYSLKNQFERAITSIGANIRRERTTISAELTKAR